MVAPHDVAQISKPVPIVSAMADNFAWNEDQVISEFHVQVMSYVPVYVLVMCQVVCQVDPSSAMVMCRLCVVCQSATCGRTCDLWCCFSVCLLSPARAFEVIPSVLIYKCMPGWLCSGLCAKLCVDHVCAASLLCGTSGYVQIYLPDMC